MSYSRIVGTGSAVPARRIDNLQLAERVDTSDEWIRSRTGIQARHLAEAGDSTSLLATEAARRALQAAGRSPGDVDLIVLATTTPDQTFPATACTVQEQLGVTKGAAFDLQAVCAGFIYALNVADRLIVSGQHRCALVIGAETFSRLLDWNDRGTCVLFGDGAGAVVLEASPEPGLLGCRLQSDGSLRHILRAPGAIRDGGIDGHPYVQMDGPAVFKVAVRELEAAARELLNQLGLQVEDLDWYIPHQANQRIIDAIADKLDLPSRRVVSELARFGNTSAASIPLALDTAVRDGRVQRGQHLMLQGIGAGMSWGSIVARY